ncbi:MAG: molybdopterin-containing oxidoreductase family iron-sulfur binding subunit [Flammeovirgaceae bacterium]|jgi:molybdopterin-containing oxidoreductase family iron-sulfur binding subunit
MGNKKKSYWKGVEQLTNRPDFVQNNEKEFPEFLSVKDSYGDNSGEEEGTNRRDFLKLMGFSVAAVSLAACETPVKKAIPYLNKPEEIDPGIPNYYASTYAMGSDYCPVVVKTREGRPIHIEGNSYSKFSNGVTSPRAVASIMSLYDVEKIGYATKKPSEGYKFKVVSDDAFLDKNELGGSINQLEGDVKIDWATADEEIKSELSNISDAGGTVYVVTNSNYSPSFHQILKDFKAKYPATKLVTYDTESLYALRMAYGGTLPNFDFGKADVVVSVGADFMGNWLSSVKIVPAYSRRRKVSKKNSNMSRHYQFESMLTVTGASADYRTPVKPSQEGEVVKALYQAVVNGTKSEMPNVNKAAQDLQNAKGKSLVVAGSNDMAIQTLVKAINDALQNSGSTIDASTPLYIKQGDDKAMTAFASNLSSNDGVIFVNCNPVYNHPLGKQLAEKVKGAKLSVSTADRINETAEFCNYNCPDSHFLESWGDYEPMKGHLSLAQPTIQKIFETRQVQDSFLKWSESDESYKDFLQEFWKSELFSTQTKELSYAKFWQVALHDGAMEASAGVSLMGSMLGGTIVDGGDDTVSAGMSVSDAMSGIKSGNADAIELVLYSSPVLGDGELANNPYIHETPEPITRVCWGNYVAVSQAWARDNNVETFETKTNVAKITVGDVEISLPIVVQPGLQKNTIAIPIGYGRNRNNAGKVAEEAGGANGFYLASATNGMVNFSNTGNITISNTGESEDVAQTQTHHTIMGRETIVQETTLSEYKDDSWLEGKYMPMIPTSEGVKRPVDLSVWDVNSDGYIEEDAEREGKVKEKAYEGTLWNDELGIKSDVYQYPIHHWGMAVDLNSCFGCGACVVACHTENNVPVVGKQEVINRREMHWIRIDRYYSSNGEAGDYHAMEEAADNPQVVFQPLMCQHCNNAPCETVCPVAATTHSSEGLNQMTYNRCVGTKYCANNCPFKVRRFNWFKYNNNNEFDYHMNNNLGKMVLNPDVTVRSRGVMEKCSMCVQRIQSGKLDAKRENRGVRDGEVKTACASACPAEAITFGDLNNSSTQVRQLLSPEVKPEGRAYNVLAEINVRPNVWYLTKVRNTDKEEA